MSNPRDAAPYRALFVVGCGFTGLAAARLALAQGCTVVGTTRDAQRVAACTAEAALRSLELAVTPALDAATLDGLLATHALDPAQTAVLVCVPPAAERPEERAAVDADDAIVAWLRRHAFAARVYVSTTGVYGAARGTVDEDTPTDRTSPRARRRLDAEARYLDAGALALRSAGIYGPGRGVHLRVARGAFRMTGEGSQVVSRVHVEDLARLALAALAREARGDAAPRRAFVVADDTPVPQREALAWLSAQLGLPLPPSAEPGEVSETLRHDRAVCNARIKAFTGLELSYPGYREGFAHCLRADGLLSG